jgi:hypothetical protein
MDGHEITVDSPGACFWMSVTANLAETGVELVPGGELSITGDVIVSAPTTSASAYLDGCSGLLTVGGNVDLIGGSLANRHAKLLVEDGQTTVMGDILMNNNRARITFDGTGTLSVGGNLSSLGLLNLADGAVEFNGTSPQVSGGFTFNNLIINNPSGVTFDEASTVNGILTLADGILSIGDHDLTIGLADSIDGGSASSYVATTGIGRVHRSVDSTHATFFPVGTAEGFDPVQVQVLSGADLFGVAVVSPVVPSTGNDDLFVQRTWVVSQSAPGSTGAVLLWLQWNAIEEGLSFERGSASCWRHDGVTWIDEGAVVSLTGSDPVVAEIAPISTVGSFAVGSSGTTGVSAGHAQPASFRLAQNYPNPFNPATRIQFSVDPSGPADLIVYNVIGEKVATVFSGYTEAGEVHSVNFDATGLSSGLYFYTLTTETRKETKRMVLAR